MGAGRGRSPRTGAARSSGSRQDRLRHLDSFGTGEHRRGAHRGVQREYHPAHHVTDNVGRLIEHLGATPAAVLGTSSGATYWFERELRQYPAGELDLDALQRRAERIVLLAGQNCRGYPAYQVNVELGRILGRELVETPGGHVAAGTHPIELSRTLHHALSTCRTDNPALEPDQPGKQQ